MILKILPILVLLINAKVENFPALIKQVKSAVATVYIYDDKWKVINQGTGFFISPVLMVSTKHVFWKNEMQDAAFSKVIPNGKGSTLYYVNKILIDSSEYDLIIFSLETMATPSNIIQRTLTIAPTELDEGEDIFVISSPLDLHGVISTGIVSAIHNKIDIQISASISTGSSGAPIFNSQGEVVGVVTGFFTNGQNINFGVSVYALQEVLKNLQIKKQTWEISQSRRLIDSDCVISDKLLAPSTNPIPEREVIDDFGYADSLADWIRKQNSLVEKKEYGVKPFFDALVNFPNKILRRFDFISTETPSQSPPVCPLKQKDEL